MIFEGAGIKYAASIMNLVVITAIIAAANASTYTASPVLWRMGKVNEEPKSLQQINVHGVPIMGVVVTAAVSV